MSTEKDDDLKKAAENLSIPNDAPMEEWKKEEPANGGTITALSHGALGVGEVKGESFWNDDNSITFKKGSFDRGEFERISNEAIKFLNEHYHPHAKMIITTTGAEIVEGSASHTNNKYSKD